MGSVLRPFIGFREDISSELIKCETRHLAVLAGSTVRLHNSTGVASAEWSHANVNKLPQKGDLHSFLQKESPAV